MYSATYYGRELGRKDSYEYAASAIGLPALYGVNTQQDIQRQLQHDADDLVKRASRAASCVGGFYNRQTSSDEEDLNYESDSEVIKSTIEDFIQHQEMDGNITLPLENSTIQEMIKMFMSCQECKEICTRPKQLQCAHTICKKCAMSTRKRHVDPGQWMIRCRICSQLTTWYGNTLNGLQDNTTMQQMVNKRSNKQQLRHNNDMLNTQNGKITMYGDQDLTINIVSSAKEKVEIQKALETAERKIELCQKQTKQVKDYEKGVNQAKMLIRRQIEQSADLFVSSIRSHQAQLMDDVDSIFQKDFKPVNEAKEAIEMQMQSLKLVTQCCCVASKILQSGGAPLDLNNFKNMVWETMKKTKAGKLPTEIRRRYKSYIKFKSNEPNYEDLADQIGQLISKKLPKVRRDAEEKRQVQDDFSPPPPPIRNHVTEPELIIVNDDDDEEPIYDLPPNEMETIAQQEEILNEERMNEAENETLYDEIPFYADNPSPIPPPPFFPRENLIPPPPDLSNLLPLPPPMSLLKPKTPVNQQKPVDLPSLPPPPVPQNDIKNIGYNTLHNAIEMIGNRRRAIHGDSDENVESDDSFSSSGDEGQFQACPTPKERSRRGSTIARSVAGSRASRRPSRSRPASPLDSQEINKAIECNTLPRASGLIIGSERQSEMNSGSSLVSKMLKRSRSFRSLVGSSNESAILSNFDSEKLLYCIGKAKKPGSASNNTQQFNGAPEIAVGSDDTIWVADTSNHRIQLHEGGGGKLAGMFKTSIQGVLLKPKSVTAFKGGKKIAVSHGKYATVWTEGGELVRQIGPHSSFGKLGGMAIDSQGSLVLADTDNNSLVLTSTNRIVPDVAMGHTGTGKSQWPGRIAVNNIDQMIVPDYGMHDIKIFNYSGQLVTKFGSFGVEGGQFRYPSAVAVDSYNRIYVADECNNRVSIFSSDGEDFLGHVITKEDGLAFPHAIAVFSDGAIAVADDSKVVKVYRGVGATN